MPDAPSGTEEVVLPSELEVLDSIDESTLKYSRLAGIDNGTATMVAMAAIEAVGLEVAGPVDFLVAGPSGFAIVMQTGRTRLLVGKEDFTARLERYLTARGRIPDGAEVDLRFRVRVSYHEPNAVAAATSWNTGFTSGRFAGTVMRNDPRETSVSAVAGAIEPFKSKSISFFFCQRGSLFPW